MTGDDPTRATDADPARATDADPARTTADDPTRAELAARVADLEARFDEAADAGERVEDAGGDGAGASGHAEDSGNGTSDAADTRKLSIVATKGTLDMAYPPLILATTAAAFDWDVTVFHTFWGLDVLHEDRADDLALSAVGNPSLPVPNLLAALPGADRATTRLMERKLDANDTASVAELLETGIELGVDFQACQMTMDLFDYDAADFPDGVTTGGGAATALADMADADVQLLV